MTIRNKVNTDGKIVFEVDVVANSSRRRGLQIRRRKFGITSRDEARKIERKLIAEVRQAMFAKENAAESWATLVDRWELALRSGRGIDRQVGQTTAVDYVQCLRQYTGHWLKKPATEITRADVKDALEQPGLAEKSNSRKRMLQNAINGLFRWAIDNRVLREVHQSPAVGITISREEKNRPEILTISEIRKLLESAQKADHPWYPVWAMALLTGMRSGELYALQWSDVDWENNLVTVSKSFNKRLRVIKCTKGGYWRDVPISSELASLMKGLRASDPNRNHVLPRLTDWNRGEQARPLRAFASGVGLPSIKFHALRACFATQLLREKVAPAIVMKICGWKDLKTMQRYIRLAGIDVEGATEPLKVLPAREVMNKVTQLFGRSQ